MSIAWFVLALFALLFNVVLLSHFIEAYKTRTTLFAIISKRIADQATMSDEEVAAVMTAIFDKHKGGVQ